MYIGTLNLSLSHMCIEYMCMYRTVSFGNSLHLLFCIIIGDAF